MTSFYGAVPADQVRARPARLPYHLQSSVLSPEKLRVVTTTCCFVNPRGPLRGAVFRKLTPPGVIATVAPFGLGNGRNGVTRGARDDLTARPHRHAHAHTRGSNAV
jgi:hypothetical protein